MSCCAFKSPYYLWSILLLNKLEIFNKHFPWATLSFLTVLVNAISWSITTQRCSCFCNCGLWRCYQRQAQLKCFSELLWSPVNAYDFLDLTSKGPSLSLLPPSHQNHHHYHPETKTKQNKQEKSPQNKHESSRCRHHDTRSIKFWDNLQFWIIHINAIFSYEWSI